MSSAQYFSGTNSDGLSYEQVIENAIESGGGGGGGDLTNYYTKTQSDSRYATNVSLSQYATDAELAAALVPYRTSAAQDITTTSFINQALAVSSAQYIEVTYDTRVGGNIASNTLMPFSQNQISAVGSSIFQIVTGNKIKILGPYTLKVTIGIAYDENSAGSTEIAVTPSFAPSDPFSHADIQTVNPGYMERSYITTATTDQEISFNLVYLNILAFGSEWMKWTISVQTLSYNSMLFVPQSNIEISNVNGLQASLNSKFVQGQQLNMDEQSITNVGGILMAPSYRITDSDTLFTPVNYDSQQMVPKRIIEQMISDTIESGGGQNSILSTGSTTQLSVADQPQPVMQLVNNTRTYFHINPAVSTFDCGQINIESAGDKYMLYTDIDTYAANASGFSLVPRQYVDDNIGGVDLSQKITYSNDVSAQIISDNDIPSKKYVDDAILAGGGGSGFDTNAAPLIRYDPLIDSLLVGSDNQNLASVQWVIDNTITGAPQLIERLNQLGNTTYTLSIDNNGRLSYKDTTPKTWFTLDTDASQVLQLNSDLEILNNYSIVGPQSISTVTPNTLFSEYGATELVQKQHIQDYIDSVIASGSSNAIVSTQNALNKLVQTGNLVDAELIHTQYEQNLGLQTDTMICSADSADGNKIKYNFKNSWLKNEQSLATIQAQTDPQIIPTKQYVDALVTPMIKNLKVNPTTAVAWATYTVTHNLGLPLQDLMLEFYLVITGANTPGFSIGTVLTTDELNYNGSSASEGFGWSVRQNAVNLNSFTVRLSNQAWTLVTAQTGNSQSELAWGAADLYVNILGMQNNKIATIQNSLSGSTYSLAETSGNFLMKNIQSNAELEFVNNVGDRRISADFLELRSYANSLIDDASVYCTFQSQDVSVNAQVIRNSSDQDVFRVTYSGNVQIAGTVQTIALSSVEYKNSVFFETRYDDMLDKMQFRPIWYKYKSEICELYGKDPKQTHVGYLYEDCKAMDPTNKFGMYSEQVMNDVNKQPTTVHTIDFDRVLFIHLTALQYQNNKQAAKIDRLERALTQVLRRLDDLEATDNVSNMNRTFDTQRSVVQKLQKKPTVGKITLK